VARSEQLRAQRVKSFIASIITDADPYVATDGEATTAVQLLHRARQRIATELSGEPEVRAELLRVLGKSYAGLFDLANAEAVLTQAVEQTGALAVGASGIADMAETLVELGEVKKLLGKGDEARALARRALSSLDMADSRHGDLYADAKLLEAGLALNKGDYSELSVAAREAIRTSVALHGEVNQRAAMAYGLVSKTRGNTPEHLQVALDAARKSYDLYRALYPAKDRPHPSVIEAQQDYGVALLGMGELKQAEVHVAQALSDARLLYGESNIMSGHFGARLGQIHVLQGRLDIGVAELRAALGVLARVDPNRGVGNAGRRRSLALGLLALHRPGDAVAPLVEAIAILEERKDQRFLLVVKADLAQARIELGQLQAASALLATIEQAGASLSPPERPLRAMARLASMRGQAQEACAHLAQALQAAQRDPRRSFLADILIDLGRAEMNLGKHDEAARHAEAALAELDRSAVAVTPNHAAAWSVLGRSLMQRGLHADALPLLQRADERWQAFGISDRWAGETARALAQTYRALGREGEAARVAARASKALASSPLPDATHESGPIRSR
jgi:tetratricopeptide (TPR) repeat protein